MTYMPRFTREAWDSSATNCVPMLSYATRIAGVGETCSDSGLHNLNRRSGRLRTNGIPLLIGHLAVCSQMVLGQISVPPSGRPVERSIHVDQSRFELQRKPFTHVNPGVLGQGGYITRDVSLRQSDYRSLDRARGGAIVEVIAHSTQYPYAVKDLFGAFRSVASRAPRTPREDVAVVNGTVDENREKWSFVEWQFSDGSAGGTICTLLREKTDIGPYEGLVGWYMRTGHTINTVMIRFTNLRGVSARLIDELLSKYPSAVVKEDFHGETWVADDVRKWIHLLQLHKSDKVMLGMALSRLAAYDPNVFGARDAAMAAESGVRASDMAAVDRAIETIRTRAEIWLAERGTKKRQRKDK